MSDADRPGGPFASSRHISDPRTLKALAHPLRLRLLDALKEHGPATATALGERLGESSGSTSYHLRQLAEHGFVEEDTDRSEGRRRYWQIVERAMTLHGFDLLARPETRDDAAVILDQIIRSRRERANRWYAEAPGWPKRWRDASVDTEARIPLTSEELQDLVGDLADVISRYATLANARGTATDDTALVDVQILAFPLHELSGDGADDDG